MPHVDGRQVAAAIKQTSPLTSVFMLTGWGRRMGDGEKIAFIDQLLGKPPNMWELRKALAEHGQTPPVR